jgi:hypothetical protein
MVMGHAKGSRMTDLHITTAGERKNMDAVAAFLAIENRWLHSA